MNNSNKRGLNFGSRPQELLSTQEGAQVLSYHKQVVEDSIRRMTRNKAVPSEAVEPVAAVGYIAPIVELTPDVTASEQQTVNLVSSESEQNATAA